MPVQRLLRLSLLVSIGLELFHALLHLMVLDLEALVVSLQLLLVHRLSFDYTRLLLDGKLMGGIHLLFLVYCLVHVANLPFQLHSCLFVVLVSLGSI